MQISYPIKSYNPFSYNKMCVKKSMINFVPSVAGDKRFPRSTPGPGPGLGCTKCNINGQHSSDWKTDWKTIENIPQLTVFQKRVCGPPMEEWEGGSQMGGC